MKCPYCQSALGSPMNRRVTVAGVAVILLGCRSCQKLIAAVKAD